jgi:multiple sugar transport system substrate-binding protein
LVFLKKTIVLTAFFLRGLRAAYFWEETMKKLILASAAALAFGAIAHAEGELVIASNASDAAPKAALEEVVAMFEAANPDINVTINTTEHEAYKTSIRNFLVADEGPDVGMWFAGNRMAGFVENGLFADISDVWSNNGLLDDMSSTAASVTFDGAQYGVPYAFYQWGVYARGDIMEANGISVPDTYDEMLAACETLNAAGITPFTIGTKYLWTAAGWFDYVNMRTNGLEYHIDLMLGKIPYTDDGVRATFANWQRAVDAGCFLEGHQNLSWQEAQAPLIAGEAAMYVMGNFLIGNLPAETQDQMTFFQFPDIDASLARGEDAPTDLYFIPSNAQNMENAKKFLAFASSAETLNVIQTATGMLSPHAGSEAPTDRFMQAGAEMLARSVTAQFYDRDTTPEMASAGMKGMVEFMLDPSAIDDILEDLEDAREEIFGAL